MNPRLGVKLGIAGLAALIALSTLALMMIEQVSAFDAFYMVMITISTVGFAEVVDLSTAGRWVTIGVMVLGVAFLFYTAGAGIEQLFEYGEERRAARVKKMIRDVTDHVILCGLGRVGTGTLKALEERGVEVVAIEADHERVQDARAEGILVLEGDATHNETLLEARIDHARALVACVTDDSDNLVIVLSARSLCKDLHIVSRASEEEWEDKLKLAGADRVVAPQVVGSERLAAMTIEHNLADIFDVVVGGRTIEFAVEEIEVSASSECVGKSIRDSRLRQRTGAMVLAVEDRARRHLMSAGPDHLFEANSFVIVVGTTSAVEQAVALLGDA